MSGPDREAAAPADEDASGGGGDRGGRLSHDGHVLLVAGGAALVAAPVGAIAGAPTGAVLLAGLGGVVGVGAATREFARGREPTAATHAGTGLPCLAAAALALRAEVLLSAAVLGLVGVMSLGPVYERVRGR